MSLLLQKYLTSVRVDPASLDAGFLACLSTLEQVASVSPDLARSIVQEFTDQRCNIKLIASENYSSLATQCAMANLLTDKYAEGVPGRRFYAGCENVDVIEQEAADRARELFGADHAYVQPHSGADANLVAFWAILRARIELPTMLEKRGIEYDLNRTPSDLESEVSASDWINLPPDQWEEIRLQLGRQRLLALELSSGGHLTHGYRLNASGKMFEARGYTVDRETHRLDYDAIRQQAVEFRPLILIAGFSAYPRNINYAVMREIADEVGAVLMVDMAHFAGLVAGGVLTGENHPVQHAQFVTSTTHKTLRGPRGGLVLCESGFSEQVNKGCPLVLGGPLPHVMAAKAICFTEALQPSFKEYAQLIVRNSQALAEAFLSEGLDIVTGGTDNHLVLLDVRSFGLSGRQAETAVRECGITLNRNTIPFDPNGAWYTSGLRLGTAAVSTLGMGPEEMKEIAAVMALVLTHTQAGTTKSGKPGKAAYLLDEKTRDEARARANDLLAKYPVYPEIDLGFLQESFGVDIGNTAGGKIVRA